MSSQPPSSEPVDLRSLLERELQERRGRPARPGEIFVLPETAELPVEWALLEALSETFLAVPADTQSLAGSHDLSLGADVLSGPLVLRCGHAVEISASRLRPELRTGVLDPSTLAAARALAESIAAGNVLQDPMAEEIERDPEYRDWVEETVGPARAAIKGLGVDEERKTEPKVLPFEARPKRRIAIARHVLPWLVAACFAVTLGLQRSELRRLRVGLTAPRFNEPRRFLSPGTVRGAVDFELPPASGGLNDRVGLYGSFPIDLPPSKAVSIVLFDRRDRELARGPLEPPNFQVGWNLNLTRRALPVGLYRLELQGSDGNMIQSWTINVIDGSSER